MPFIASDGSLCQTQPWSVSRLNQIMWSIFGFFVQFASTLTEPLVQALGNGSNSNTNSRQSSGSGWSSAFRGLGGSGSSGSGGGSGGPRPNRRIGRINTIADVQVPGGCSGGSCGM